VIDLSERLLGVNVNCPDNGGRRKDSDRRQFTYTFHIPERRSGVDRRTGKDRRESIRKEDNNLVLTL